MTDQPANYPNWLLDCFGPSKKGRILTDMAKALWDRRGHSITFGELLSTVGHTLQKDAEDLRRPRNDVTKDERKRLHEKSSSLAGRMKYLVDRLNYRAKNFGWEIELNGGKHDVNHYQPEHCLRLQKSPEASDPAIAEAEKFFPAFEKNDRSGKMATRIEVRRRFQTEKVWWKPWDDLDLPNEARYRDWVRRVLPPNEFDELFAGDSPADWDNPPNATEVTLDPVPAAPEKLPLWGGWAWGAVGFHEYEEGTSEWTGVIEVERVKFADWWAVARPGRQLPPELQTEGASMDSRTALWRRSVLLRKKRAMPPQLPSVPALALLHAVTICVLGAQGKPWKDRSVVLCVRRDPNLIYHAKPEYIGPSERLTVSARTREDSRPPDLDIQVERSLAADLGLEGKSLSKCRWHGVAFDPGIGRCNVFGSVRIDASPWEMRRLFRRREIRQRTRGIIVLNMEAVCDALNQEDAEEHIRNLLPKNIRDLTFSPVLLPALRLSLRRPA